MEFIFRILIPVFEPYAFSADDKLGFEKLIPRQNWV